MTRTRFAPSPTGYLHIGGVRTALFNWLLARRHGGQFILRIDDTDLGRNNPAAVQPILDGFTWLGMAWDEGPTADGQGSVGPFAPYFQSQRNDTYVAAARELIRLGRAYPDDMTKDEQTADRVEKHLATFRAANPGASAAQLKKESDAAAIGQRPYTFRGKLRDANPAENLAKYEAAPGPVRFKVPLGETVVVTDLIRARTREGDEVRPGVVEFSSDAIGDPVILRGPDPADGVCRPLYNFATVVDEVNLKVTHVVRAAEHFSNTAGQVLMFRALGAEPPTFAHVPLVNAPKSSKKLSKREMGQFVTPEVIAKLRAARAVPEGATDAEIKAQEMLNPATVEYYRVLGYLPSAVLNYLGRLGWSMDDHTEFMTVDDMIANFSLERVNEAPASFDPDKLYWLAGEHMAKLSPADKVEGSRPFIEKAGLIGPALDDATRAKLEAITVAAADRVKLFSEMIQYAGPLLVDVPEYDAKARAALQKPGVAERLREYRGVLATLEPFTAEALKASFGQFAEAHGIKPKELDAPLRVAVTGVTVGFGLPETIEILGRAATLKRLDAALGAVGNP